MNIASLSARLMDLPDEALVNEMKRPTGSAPQFLVMSELQRRQKIRSSARTQQAPSSTVADDLIAGTQPRPDTTGIASGLRGPRGFADGGPVRYPAPGWYGIGQRGDRGDGFIRDAMASMASKWVSDESDPYAAPGWYGVGQRGDRGVPSVLAEQSREGSRANPAPGRMVDRTASMPAGNYNSRVGGYVPTSGSGRFSGNNSPPSDFSLTPWQADPNTASFNFDLPQDEPLPPQVAAAQARSAPAPGGKNVPRETSLSVRSSSKGGGSAGLPTISGDELEGPSTSRAENPGTDFDEWMANIKKVNDSGIFANPEMEEIRGTLAQRRAQLAGITKDAPWAALAKAGFKMASGTSPFFATNAGEGLAGLTDDIQQSKIDDLKTQLMMDGMAAKVAEAEATRRIKSADMATNLMNRQDAIKQRDSEAKYRVHEMAMRRADINARAGEASANRQDTKFYALYNAADSNYRNAVANAERELQKKEANWLKANPMGAMNGQTSGYSVMDMPSWKVAERAEEQVNKLQEKLFGMTGIKSVAPKPAAAAQPRRAPAPPPGFKMIGG